MAAGDGFADALVELVEDIFGMNQRAEAVVVAYKDAAVKAIVDTIPGFQHGTVARKYSVAVNEAELLAQIAWRIGVK